VRRILNKRARKDTRIQFYKAMTASLLIYGSEIWAITKKKGSKFETAEMKLLRSAAGYITMNQMMNPKIWE
jgi:hypothetical protein